MMDLEEFIRGYCRAVDGARTVTLEGTGGDFEVDCGYGKCPHEPECPIAQRIRELTQE